MTRMTGPDCAVMCNLINTHAHTHSYVPRVQSKLSRALHARTPWEEAPARSPNPRKCGDEESYGNIWGSVGEGRHDICRMPGVFAKRHDGGSPVEGNLRQEPGVA